MPATYKIIIAITGLVSLVPMLGLAFAGRRAERRHLLAHGARATGRVIAIERHADSTKSAPLLRYRFTPDGGAAPVEGRCTVNLFVPYKPGDEAVVCYNAKHPASSIILSPKGQPL